jgi:peptidoglycan/LPS O-acetylase OafA/YrhL
MNFSQPHLLKTNNFNLIRILASIQVFITHGIDHLNIKTEWLLFIYYKFLIYFPGVPIFFTISGFLIYASYDRHHTDLRNFFRNRILRIYPGLFFCLLFTILLLYSDYPLAKATLFSKHFFIWLFTQLSLFQFYTPDILRFWGVGTPNGSLWTISIEMQFYLIIPLIFLLFKYFRNWQYAFWGLFIASILVNISFTDRANIFEKLYHEFIFKYLYYFLFGIFAYKMWDKVNSIFVNRFLLISIIYIIYAVIFGNLFGYRIEAYILESPFGFIANALLSIWTLAFAFSNTSLSQMVIKNQDLSYGMYIYHMPVINFLNHHNYIGSLVYFGIAFIVTLILSSISWNFVEKNALRFKRANLTTIK